MLTSALILFATVAVVSGACPPWTSYYSTTDHCQCGDSLRGIVDCDSGSLSVSVRACYCMTYNLHLKEIFVGHCLTNCRIGGYFLLNTTDVSLINNVTCQGYKRTGQLCGECMEGYGPPVYSYLLQCVECSESDFKYNLLRYITIAFGPLTLFYLVVVVFKISVTFGSMMGYVLISQIFAMRANCIYILTDDNYGLGNVVGVTITALWNLDILRSLYSPFCIHPKMTPLQVLALDYLVGVYPLFLIFLTYIAVSLHDRYSLVVNMWKPAYKCLSYFRKVWDIRGSLVQAFATFLVLSYVKILNVSFDLLAPVFLQTMENTYLKQPYLYNDGEILYFGREHLPYGVLAILMLVVFNILPLILLLVFPCSCFQKCLHCCRLRSHALHAFMDTLQGCYRHHPKDCRYFASFYLFLRLLSVLTLYLIRDKGLSISVIGLYFIILALILIHIKPYKKDFYNKSDTTLNLLAAYVAVTFNDCGTAMRWTCYLIRKSGTVVATLLILFEMILCVRLYFLPMKLEIVVTAYVLSKRKEMSELRNDDVEESLPHRIHHENEYSPLIKVA